VSGWQTTAPLTTARAGAAVVEAGGYLYALGGVDGRDFLRTVEYAPILADGSLGPWNLAAPLTEARGFFDAVAHGGYLYAAGGGNGPNGEHLLNSVERAPLRADGRLGAWERLPVTLNLPRRCVKLAVIGDTLYALGGFGGTLLDTVERTAFSADGGLGPFELLSERLTMPRYVNAAKAHGDTLYVLGGHNENEGTGVTAVEYATGKAGAPPVWKRTAAMAQGRYALSALIHGDFLYALGGLDGARYSDSIELSRIAANGTLAPWRMTTALSSPRANFGALEYQDRIYIVGGTNRDGYYRTVEVAQFNVDGDIGYWATPAEAAAARQRAAAQAEHARTANLPNEGVVREVVNTEVYSYIRVAGQEGERWIASSRIDCPVNRRIRYSRGTEMTGFHSRALGRDFDSILFVEGAACVE
jgi:hypothetical protein